jgi:5,10-methylenetetrahydromethanopterin reductase
MPGVIGHLVNPSVDEAVALARASEEAGAAWLGLADAFWWRDTWVLLSEAARATTELRLGPTMTNPYLRHPFHTVAALATLQELAGDRIFLGLAAGGSELTLAAGVDRADAPARVRRLIQLVRAVAAGAALDGASGRRLEVALLPVPILVAGGRDGMLRAAGSAADLALVWAAAASDLERMASVIRRAAAGRTDGGPQIVWAPLVELAEDPGADLAGVAVYAALNADSATVARWDMGPEHVGRIRAALVAGDRDAARRMLPDAALDDLILSGPAAMPEATAARAREIGAVAIAVPGFAVRTVGERIAWGTAVEAALQRG